MKAEFACHCPDFMPTSTTNLSSYTGRKIAPNAGANATKFFTLATKS